MGPDPGQSLIGVKSSNLPVLCTNNTTNNTTNSKLIIYDVVPRYEHKILAATFFNLQTLTWKSKQSMPSDIAFGASVPFEDSFLIVGGYSYATAQELDTIYYYNPNTNEWELLSQHLKEMRRKFTAFMVPDTFGNCE